MHTSEENSNHVPPAIFCVFATTWNGLNLIMAKEVGLNYFHNYVLYNNAFVVATFNPYRIKQNAYFIYQVWLVVHIFIDVCFR